MYKIVSKEQFSQNVFRLCVEAPLIARACRAGNFVIVRIAEKGERIPLTIAASDAEKGTRSLFSIRVSKYIGINFQDSSHRFAIGFD